MIFGEYSGDVSKAKGEIGLVIASIYEQGDVANVIYYSSKKPLVLVPKSVFVLKSNGCPGISNSQRSRRTGRFKVGDNVEFQLTPGSDRIVQWIRKAESDMMNTFLSQDKFVTKTTGVISPTNVKQDGLWTKDFDWIPSDPELIRNYEAEIPMNVTIVIDISFGEHENARFFKLDDFKPTFTYKLLSIDSVSKNPDFLHNAPWKQIPDLVSDRDMAPESAEASVKSEEDNSNQPKSSQNASSRTLFRERAFISKNVDLINSAMWKQIPKLVSGHNLAREAAEASVKSEDEISDRSKSSQSASSWTSSRGRGNFNLPIPLNRSCFREYSESGSNSSFRGRGLLSNRKTPPFIPPKPSTKRIPAKKPCLNLIKADMLLGLGICPKKLKTKIQNELLPRVKLSFDRNDWKEYFDSDDEIEKKQENIGGDYDDAFGFEEIPTDIKKWRRVGANELNIAS